MPEMTAAFRSEAELIRARATDFDFPARVEAAFSTFALSLEPRFDEVIAKAAATLVPGGRFVLLDLRMPDNWLRHLAPALVRLVRPFAVSIEVAKRQLRGGVGQCVKRRRSPQLAEEGHQRVRRFLAIHRLPRRAARGQLDPLGHDRASAPFRQPAGGTRRCFPELQELTHCR